MYKSLLLLLAVFCILSCNSKKELTINDAGALVIDLSNDQAQGSLDSIVSDITCVGLQTPQYSRFSGTDGIRKTLIHEDKMYLLDRDFASIKCYGLDGKFLFDLGGVGVGSDQFLRAEDIEFNPTSNTLWVLCNNPKKIIEFSLNGKFINKIDIDFFASSIGFNANNTRWFHVNQNASLLSGNRNLLLTDSTNSIKERLFPWPKSLKSMIEFTGGFNRVGKALLYNPPFETTYYQITDTTINAKYKFVIDDKEPDTSYQKKSRLGLSLIETTDYIGFNYYKYPYLKTAFYNKKTRRIFSTDPKKSLMNVLLNSTVINQNGDTVIMLLQPNQMKAFLNSNASFFQKRSPELYQKLTGKSTSQNSFADIFVVKVILKQI